MKTVFLKKVAIVVFTVVTMSVSAVAQQKGDMAAGGNLVIGTGNSFTNYGIGAKFLYNVTDPIRLAGEFDYFLKKDYLSMWDFSVYGHYLFPVAESVVVYPSVGLGLIGSTVSMPTIDIPGMGTYGGSQSGSDFAFSLGAGADYKLTSNLTLNGEIRIKMSNGTRFNLALGVAYKF